MTSRVSFRLADGESFRERFLPAVTCSFTLTVVALVKQLKKVAVRAGCARLLKEVRLLANANVAFLVPGFLPPLRPVSDVPAIRGWRCNRRLYETTAWKFVILCRTRTYLAIPAIMMVAHIALARLLEEVLFLACMNSGSPVL